MLSARILRLLATNHIFTEVSPDVFANNRLSSVLDTGKPVEELVARLVPSLMISSNKLMILSPESKHRGTPGMTSFLQHLYELFTEFSYDIQILMRFRRLDEGFKTSSVLTETLLDPQIGHASDANKAAFNKAYNTDKDIWNWWELPGNEIRIARFGVGMGSVSRMTPPEALLEGSVMLRVFADHNLTWRCHNGRVRLGKSPARLDSCGCWRRCRRTVVNARYASPATSLRRPRP